jgi:hypothetical protein
VRQTLDGAGNGSCIRLNRIAVGAMPFLYRGYICYRIVGNRTFQPLDE